MENILETLKYLLFGLSIGIGIYYARYLKAFFLWIKEGIQDGDNKLQNKELQIAIFSLLSPSELLGEIKCKKWWETLN